MLRSETLNYYSITFIYDNALEAIESLSAIGGIHIDDLQYNTPKRMFSNEVQDASERLLIINEIENLLLEHGLLQGKMEFDSEKAQKVLDHHGGWSKSLSVSESRCIDEIQEKHQALYKMLGNKKSIGAQIEGIEETIDALEVVSSFLRDVHKDNLSWNDQQIKLLAYVVHNGHLKPLQRVLFRLTRGLVLINYIPTKDQKKSVIFIIFLASQMGYLLEKVKKSLDNGNAREIKLPKDSFELHDYYSWANRARLDAIKTIDRSRDQINSVLAWFIEEGDVAGVSRIYESKVLLLKQKELFITLGYFLKSGEILEGRFWISKKEENLILDQIGSQARQKGFQAFRLLKLSVSKYDEVPPTKISRSSFLQNFQEIVDTYGVPRYKEINPGLFTTVTFPFLFGIMFGDVGHGGLLWIFGMLLRSKPHWFPKALQNYSHIITLMGFFAFYCGFVYNDFFSLPLILQKSCYEAPTLKRRSDCVYSFGIDYVWHGNKSGISFLNSYKMKISIIYGVIHMTLGILLKGWNNLYFREGATFMFEFLPQLIFFLATFGYMAFCIVIKWLTDFSATHRQPPSIIGLFINFVSRIDHVLYWSASDQLKVQKILALVAVCCIPLLFLGRPIAHRLYRAFGNKKKAYYQYLSTRSLEISHNELLEEQEINLNESFGSLKIYSTIVEKPAYKKLRLREAEHSFGEEIIHQSIETIEFILGSVSNTASYLRLWALSLAHNQLAKVFFEMILKPFLTGKTGIISDVAGIVLAFIGLFMVTFGVLMCMDLMECFLHALRLHWVEFQNKFYKGDGYLFEDFEIIAVLKKSFG